jgi:hypothetical protein
MTLLQFFFILHLLKETLQIIGNLCQELQCKFQDILNVMHLVSSTKALIQEYRDDKWYVLLTNVKSLCEKRNIDVSYMNARYVDRRGQAHHQQDDFTIKQHYQVDNLCDGIDS